MVTQPPTNKKVVTGAFFDVKAVDALCRSHGLLFKDRITYVDPYTVHLTGSVIKEGRHPVSSMYERRKKATKGQRRNYWLDAFIESGLTKAEVFEKASAMADQVKLQEKEVRSKRKQVTSSLHIQTALKDALKLLDSDSTRIELKDAQQTLRKHREELEPLEEALQLLKNEQYKYNKMHKAAIESGSDVESVKNKDGSAGRSSSSKMTVPTWEVPACEDRADKMDIRNLICNARGTNKLVTVAGTDYGLVTMVETVPLTLAQVETHINRFEMLQNNPDAILDENLSDMKFPRAIRITAAQIDSVSRTRYIAKRRERRLRQDKEVQDAMATVSTPENSLSLATTLPAVDKAHSHRKGIAVTLRKFERTKPRLRDLHTKELRTKRAWARLCAQERRQVKEHASAASPAPLESSVSSADGWSEMCCAHHVPRHFRDGRPFQHLASCPRIAPAIMPVLSIGDAGTCVGSRLKGHLRRGGTKLRSQHRQSCPVLITDEYRTSKMCLYCSKQMSLARARRIVKGQIKFVRVHGAVECTNAKCVSFKRHYSIRPRDTNAAAAIAVVGTAQALRKGRLKVFSRGSTTNNASPSALEPPTNTQHLSGCTECTSGERGL
ncbi:hypothetical protein EC968_007395 [Mortierella alpina]|nr:hypothetical protein EC968_007395 [Mortierella alpina]